MNIVIFGLSVSSSWGNGHATLLRGLIRALGERGHHTVFFERDVPYYAGHRDLRELSGGELVLYPDWHEILPLARRVVARSDAAIVTSYCFDAMPVTDVVVESARPLRVFYDLDTPVTLSGLRAGESVPYIGPSGLRDFDLVLSFSGGPSLDELRDRLGARATAALPGGVDPAVHHASQRRPEFAGDISYLGTYSADRQETLERLFIEPARRAPNKRFVLAGAQYPHDFPWGDNVYFVRHLPPAEHPAFLCSSRLTLNVTRQPMAEMGFSPSARLFEAAACGVPLVSDWWEGLDHFFEPGVEILVARHADDVLDAFARSDADLRAIGTAASRRALAEHTCARRAIELERLLQSPPAHTGSELRPVADRNSPAPLPERHGTTLPSGSHM